MILRHVNNHSILENSQSLYQTNDEIPTDAIIFHQASSSSIEGLDGFLTRNTELRDKTTKEIKISEFVRIYENLKNENYVVGVENLIQRVSAKSDLEKICEIYQRCFTNMPQVNAVYLFNNFQTYGIYVWGNMVGGFTVNRVRKDQLFYVQLVFLAIDPQHQGKGYGKRCIEYLQGRYNNIALYSDHNSVKFYEKSTFKRNDILEKTLLKNGLLHEKHALFMFWGFKDLSLKKPKKIRFVRNLNLSK